MDGNTETITVTYYDGDGHVVEGKTVELPAGTWSALVSGKEVAELESVQPESATHGDFVNEATGEVHRFTC